MDFAKGSVIMEEANKIKFALFLQGWDFLAGDKAILRQRARRIPPLDFNIDMKGALFCPECCAPLFRSPEDRDFATNGRRAFFAHSRGFDTRCSLRVEQRGGKRYETEEEARQAIESGELVIISTLMKDKPEPPDIDGPLGYDREPNEDADGPLSLIPISRHNGEHFNLPSRVTTIRGLCRNFDEKLYKYILFPGQNSAKTLYQQLNNVEQIEDVCEEPRLYFGTIVRSVNMGPGPRNIRQTFLRFAGGGYKDFCLKATDESSREHGIDDDSIGKIVIAYGKVTLSGLGLCIGKLGWGEFCILPEMYSALIADD
jgi:hypothetical protein